MQYDCNRTDMHVCGDDVRQNYVTRIGELTMRTCHVLMAIDRSGSMHHLADDVRGGFNSYIDELATDTETDYYVSVALFADDVTLVHSEVPLADVRPLGPQSYVPRGSTALHDAVGHLLTRSASEDYDRSLMVVNTDGFENASREWTEPALKALIAQRKEDPRWGFVFLGAHPDAWRQGDGMGYASAQTVNSSWGTRGSYAAMAGSTISFAEGASAQSVADAVGEASRNADADHE